MKSQNGFTLVELLITLLVASILIAIAVPAFNDFIQNNRVTASSNEFSTGLATARSEAIHRHESVTLCSSANGATCSASVNWQTGWIIFNDQNGNGTIDGTDGVLRVWNALPVGFTLTQTTATRILFDRLGGATLVPAAGQPIFVVGNPDCVTGELNREREIFVSGSGAIGVTRSDCP